MNRVIQSGLMVIALLGLLLPTGPAAQRVQAMPGDTAARLIAVNDSGLVFELEIPLPEIQEVVVEGQVFQRLSIPGYVSAGKPGHPELPQIGVMLGIPVDGPVELRVVDSLVEELPGFYRVYPAPEWVVQYDPESGLPDPVAGVQEQFAWDGEEYHADEFQPQDIVFVSDAGFIRSQRVARVTIQPLQYNPAQGTLRIHRWLRVEATFPGATAGTPRAGATADLFDPVLRSQLLNFDQASAWRSERGQPLDSAGRAPDSIFPGDTSRPWFKTQVKHSGLYKVTLADLQASELAPLAAANPAYLQVWTRGEQVAAHFIGDDDAQFEPDEALVFYADVEPDIYSETEVYWLTVGDVPGLRMGSSNASPSGAATDTAVWTTAHFEEDFIYRGDLPGYGTPAPYPRWYWADLNSLGTTSFTAYKTLPAAVTSGYTASLRVRIHGASQIPGVSLDHRIRVELNGQVVGIMTWKGFTAAQQEFAVPAAWLQRGLNALTLTIESIPGVVVDRSFFDWFEIDYRQSLLAINDQVSFAAAGGGQREFQVTGFHGQDVLAFDVTNPSAPLRLTGLVAAPASTAPETGPEVAMPDGVTSSSPRQVFLPIAGSPGPAGSGATVNVRFGVTSATPRTYALGRIATVSHVPPLSLDIGSALRNPTNRADYLLVAHRSLWPAAQALAQHREASGLTVALIDVQDVMDEFGGGRMNPGSIRDFVAYAYSNWQAPAPSYLLLLGSGHSDYRMRTGLAARPVLVPPFIACVDPWNCEVAVENEFVTVSGDDRLPDLALGRLPAKNLDEANVLVNKIINYEASPPSGSWSGTLAFVADNYRSASGAPDPAGNFEALSEGIIAITPPQYTVQRVFYDPYPDDDDDEPFRYRTPTATTDAIVATVNSGAVFLNYIGHAGITTWAHEAILRAHDWGRNDVTRFTNGPRQPIVLDMACVSGNFADPVYTGIEVMMLNWPVGGSVAGWGATGFGVATGHDQLHRGFYQAVFNNGVRTLGLATGAGKQALWNAGFSLDLLDTFDLLGDPALQIYLQPTAN